MHPLKKLIYEKGYTIEAFASKVGVDKKTLFKIFGKKCKARGTTIFLIANGLEISFDTCMEICNG